MTDKQMLVRLDQLRKKTNSYWVASELGYRSPNTILNWIKNKKIPKVAVDKVRGYLNVDVG